MSDARAYPALVAESLIIKVMASPGLKVGAPPKVMFVVAQATEVRLAAAVKGTAAPAVSYKTTSNLFWAMFAVPVL